MTTDQKTPGQVLYEAAGQIYVIDWSTVPADLKERLENCAAAVIAHDRANQPAASGVPEGWKMVPIAVSQPMIDAAASLQGIRTIDNVLALHAMRNSAMTTLPGLEYPDGDSLLAHLYRTMLAAAPEAPKP